MRTGDLTLGPFPEGRPLQNQGALHERRTGTGFALAKLSEILRLRSQTRFAQDGGKGERGLTLLGMTENGVGSASLRMTEKRVAMLAPEARLASLRAPQRRGDPLLRR